MKIVYLKAARKAVLKSNKRTLLLEKIGQLANDPASLKPNVTQLKGRQESRLRVQDWRVIFVIDGNCLLIRDVAPRSSASEVEE